MPPGMVQRLGTTRYKVPGWWRQMAFAGNDDWVWIKSDSRVDVLHRESGRVVPFEKLRRGEERVGAIAASPDGSRVAVGFSGSSLDAPQETTYRVVILSARTTAHQRDWSWKIENQNSTCTCLALSSDGSRLLTATENGHLQLWDTGTGERLAEQKVEPVTFRDAALSPDGKLAVITGWNRSSRLWKIEEGEVIPLAPKQDGASACYAPDGNLFAIISDDGIHLWAPETVTAVAHLKNAARYDNADFGIDFTPDGRFLAVPAHTEDRVELWDVARRECVATLPVESVRGVAISADGRWLAAAGGDSEISIFDLRTREGVSHPQGHNESATAIRFLDDHELLTAGVGEVVMWNLSTGRPERRLEHEKRARVAGIAISPDRNTIVTSALDDTVRVWDRTTGKQRLKLPGHSRYGGLRSVQFVPDGKRFASWGDDAILRWWDPREGTLVGEHAIRVPGAPEAKDLGMLGRILAGVLAPEGKALYVSFEGELIEFDPQTGARRRSVPAKVEPYTVAMSPDGRWIAADEAVLDPARQFVGSNLLLFERATLKLAHRWRLSDDGKFHDLIGLKDAAELDDELRSRWQVRSMAFSPDSSRLAIVRRYGTTFVDVLDLATARVVNRFPIESVGVCLEFSPDGQRLAIGHHDTTVSLWSLPELPHR